MDFGKLKGNIKNCKLCRFKKNHSFPIFFNCKTPDSVKYLVITEQPKEMNEKAVDENTFIENVKNVYVKKNNKTKDHIARIFDMGSKMFSKSLQNASGPFYWTHHTKCPSSASERKDICMEHWFLEEIKQFKNLKTIFCFGSPAYNGLLSIAKKQAKYYDIIWREIEMVVKDDYNDELLKIIIDNRSIMLIVLPHPSPANPLSHFLKYMSSIINYAIGKEN